MRCEFTSGVSDGIRARGDHTDMAPLDETLTSNSNIPQDIDGNPIRWDSNPATIEGVLHEAGKFYKRKGLFQPLLTDGVVALSNGKICVPDLQSVPFISGMIKDPGSTSTTSNRRALLRRIAYGCSTRRPRSRSRRSSK